ncbi:hypothetical protein BSCH_02100 [Candidatus Paraburkholderia schumanniana]|nr:hypothetical protein BSCH_02100 [Candidatus Paraburkholderia schumannianae]
MQGTAVDPERNDAAGGEVESLFSLALNARCESAMMWLYVTAGDAVTPAFDRHRGEAYDCACRAGYRYAHEPIPHLLRDDELRQAWAHGVINRQRDRIRNLIAANDWPALALPFPEQILETLRAGKPVHVDGHGLYSEEDSICCASPSGIERIMCAARDLSLADIEGFLADMALDVEWVAALH